MRFFISLSASVLVLLSCIFPAFAETPTWTEWIPPEDYDGTNIALPPLEDSVLGTDLQSETEVQYQEHEPLDIEVGDEINEVDEVDEVPMAVFLYSAANPTASTMQEYYLDIPDNPPTNSPYIGQWYITGMSGNQRVTIYTGTPDGWGVDSNGYLYRLASSATGQLYINGTLQIARLNGYSYPAYRAGTTGNIYNDLLIVPDATNVNIFSSFPTRENSLGFAVPDYVMLFTVGLIVVILITKKR